MPRRERDPFIKLVFFSDLMIIEWMQSERGLFSLGPEELLIRLEEMLESGELTHDQIQELLK